MLSEKEWEVLKGRSHIRHLRRNPGETSPIASEPPSVNGNPTGSMSNANVQPPSSSLLAPGGARGHGRSISTHITQVEKRNALARLQGDSTTLDSSLDDDTEDEYRPRSNAISLSRISSASDMQPPPSPTQDTPVRSWSKWMETMVNSGTHFLQSLQRLVQDTRHGPRFLGPIDSHQYLSSTSGPLEEHWIAALNALFQLDNKNPWFWAQLHLFVLPFVHLVMGNIARRYVFS